MNIVCVKFDSEMSYLYFFKPLNVLNMDVRHNFAKFVQNLWNFYDFEFSKLLIISMQRGMKDFVGVRC